MDKIKAAIAQPTRSRTAYFEGVGAAICSTGGNKNDDGNGDNECSLIKYRFGKSVVSGMRTVKRMRDERIQQEPNLALSRTVGTFNMWQVSMVTALSSRGSHGKTYSIKEAAIVSLSMAGDRNLSTVPMVAAHMTSRACQQMEKLWGLRRS